MRRRRKAQNEKILSVNQRKLSSVMHCFVGGFLSFLKSSLAEVSAPSPVPSRGKSIARFDSDLFAQNLHRIHSRKVHIFCQKVKKGFQNGVQQIKMSWDDLLKR